MLTLKGVSMNLICPEVGVVLGAAYKDVFLCVAARNNGLFTNRVWTVLHTKLFKVSSVFRQS